MSSNKKELNSLELFTLDYHSLKGWKFYWAENALNRF